MNWQEELLLDELQNEITEAMYDHINPYVRAISNRNTRQFAVDAYHGFERLLAKLLLHHRRTGGLVYENVRIISDIGGDN